MHISSPQGNVPLVLYSVCTIRTIRKYSFFIHRFFFASEERVWFEFFHKIRFKSIWQMCQFFLPLTHVEMCCRKISNRHDENHQQKQQQCYDECSNRKPKKKMYSIVWLWNMFVCVVRVYFLPFLCMHSICIGRKLRVCTNLNFNDNLHWLCSRRARLALALPAIDLAANSKFIMLLLNIVVYNVVIDIEIIICTIQAF